MSNVVATGGGRSFVLVLGIDLNDQQSSGHAFDQALRLAARIPHGEVHVIHVVHPEASAEKSNEAAGLLKLYVSDKAAALGLGGPLRTGIHVRRGDPAKEIAQLAADLDADMIVVGTHKAPHLRSIFVGSTGERVLATAKCPVFVAGPRPSPQPSHIIIIEPPCPECVERRSATQGREWWCGRHAERHHLRRHHIYSYHSELPFAEHDSAVTPTGAP
ncbi:MAG TPA: universal stress protein [Polyangiaceae bacterium]|nr:universal stress protein [Polyangiaceae bacterium]